MSKISDAWGMDPDMCNRDPTPVNPHLKVSFEEVIGEPDHTTSIDCVWKFSYKCFNLWKCLCYIILSTICGIPHACCWGCVFACIAFVHIWQITPYIRCLEIQLSIQKRCLTIIMGAFVEPCCEAVGALFNAFKK